jgi:hypothetical protein
VADLKHILADPRAGKMASISMQYRVPYSTVRRWYQCLKDDPEWSPFVTAWGEHRRVFDDATESAMAEEIRDNYIRLHRYFSTDDFVALAMRWFRDVYQDFETETRFVCSPPFIEGFKRRNNFSVKRQHFKRRPACSAQDKAAFQDRLTALCQTQDNDVILNCDETAWKLFPNGILTWWDKGCDGVSLYVQGDEKDSMTVLSTISASGNKWPLCFVAKGKTDKVETSQIGDVVGHWRLHSASGWMKGDIFCEYLRHLREYESSPRRLFLILDVHPSHRTEKVKMEAQRLNIQLIYVPPGATDEMQPLDRKVFGALKSEARRLFRQAAADNPTLKISRRNAAIFMCEAWAQLGDATLLAAWNIYQADEVWE